MKKAVASLAAAAATASFFVLAAPSANAALSRFTFLSSSGVAGTQSWTTNTAGDLLTTLTYSATGGTGFTYTSSSYNGSGRFIGSFDFNTTATAGAYNLTNVNVVATSIPFGDLSPIGDSTSQNSYSTVGDQFNAGKIILDNTANATLILWNTRLYQSNPAVATTNGVALTIASAVFTGTPATNGTVTNISSTANDNACNSVNVGTTSATQFCGNRSNNLSNRAGQLQATLVPSPALAAGLLPLAALAIKRRKSNSKDLAATA